MTEQLTKLLPLLTKFIVSWILKNDFCVVALDITKTFDRVFLRGLLFKLQQNGIEGNLLKWLESYLSHRKQRVVLNGISSEWREINAGVPQGSILGPLLFLVFINDIVDDIESQINLFADDTSLMMPIENIDSSFRALSNDLIKLSVWAKQWLVSFNANKTVYMIFSLRKQNRNYPCLKFNDVTLKQVTTHTHLGITFNSKMTWHNHINRISEKASKVINMLKRIRHLIPRSCLEQSYKTLVLPIIEYGDVVYDNLSTCLRVTSLNLRQG